MRRDDRLLPLLDRVREIVDDAAPPPWGDLWDHSAEAGTIGMFSFPNPLPGTGLAPYVFAPDANFYARLFGYSLEDVFTDAYTWLCFSLEQMIWNHDHLQHDGSSGKTILINQLGFFAPSLFGVAIKYADDAVPWIGEPVINQQADLAKLKAPDFYTSGLSPLVHRMYEEAQKLLPDDFAVEFTTWLTGPFSLIFHLRGPLNLAVDIMEAPDFVHEMMAFATESMTSWWLDREHFLGRDKHEPLLLGNDEVGVPMISPAHYEEFVLPYETALANVFGIDYWHSCSNTTLLMPYLARLPNLRMMDVGPWTALQPAIDSFGKRPGSSIMKRLHPVSEILLSDEPQMRQRLLQIKAMCYDAPYMLFFDGVNVLDSVERTVRQIKLLDRLCHEIFHVDRSRPAVEPEHFAARLTSAPDN